MIIKTDIKKLKYFFNRSNLNCITEELKNPNINLPRGIMIGIPFVTFVYLSANIAYFAVLSPQTIIQSNAVAVVRNYHNIRYFPRQYIQDIS